jgi:transcriptional regulator with XRE-family HTH domain
MTSLRRIRTERNIPLYVLARRARVSTSTLWAWERHNCPPATMEPVRRVAAVLGVEPEELLEPDMQEAQP